MKFSRQVFTRIYKALSPVRYSLFTACLFSVGISNTLHAEPGLVEDSPLFLANRAEPNIFFMVDDSGSMDIEMLTPETVYGWGGAMMLNPAAAGSFDDGIYNYLFGEHDAGFARSTNYQSWSGNVQNQNTYVNGFILPTQAYIDATYTGIQTPEQQGTWRGRNSDYNQLYYNPTREYQPWVGLNDAGNPFPDYKDTNIALPANVPIDPYYTGADTYNLLTDKNVVTGTINDRGTGANITITPAAYWVWEDTNTDGTLDNNSVVDPTDSHARVVITTASTCTGGLTETKANQIADSCILRSYDAEIRNFTNWFVYHRKRDFSSKYAMSQVISSADKIRMGMATINDDKPDSNIRLESMLPDVSTGNKAALLNGLFRMNSDRSTPLRTALQRAGEYFACSGTANVPDFAGTGIDCALIKTPVGSEPAACQQNFTVLITDGERSTSSTPPYTTDVPAGINNADNTADPFTGYFPGGNPDTTTTLSFGGYDPYADPVRNTLADVAMHYYERDLDPAIDNRVPIVCGVDENPAQHMVTYTVGFGVSGLVDLTALPTHPARGYAPGCSPTTGASFDWNTPLTDPANDSAEVFSGTAKVDDLVHAAFNGRGQYLSATNAEGLTRSLDNAMRNIASRIGSASAVSINSSSLNTDSTAYFAKFSSATWQGEFAAYSIVNNTIDLTSPDWEAHDLLEAKDPDNRSIVTFDRSSTSYGAIPFRTLASLPARHQDDLMTTPADVIDNSAPGLLTAQARLDYIRGEHSCEATDTGTCATGKDFRDRIFIDSSATSSRFKLGDIIHSSAVYVGAPQGLLPGTDPFGATGKRFSEYVSGIGTASGAFSSTNNAQTRTKMLYVGANDGMLHAFNAVTGDEVWAYIPGALFHTEAVAPAPYFGPGLHTLTERSYEHRYYVDLSPSVADVYADIGGASGDDWHTVLVGGLRAGGRGYFAIDITDPDELINTTAGSARETALANRVLWEFTTDDDRDLGLTYSEPQIVPLGDSSGTIEWYAVFGNGYNSLNGNTDYAAVTPGPDDDPYIVGNNTHSAKIFILKIEGPGTDGVWTEGTDYWKIDTEYPTGASLSETVRNGLSTPALAESDSDSIADHAYAGDLFGNLWAFNVTGTNTTSWGAYTDSLGTTPTPLFIATDAASGAGNRQAITAKPSLIRNSRVNLIQSGTDANAPNIIVMFGTGSYLNTSDLNDTQPQSFYAVWDSGPDQAPLNNSNLIHQPIATDTGPIAGEIYRTIPIPPATATVDYEIGTNYGWYHNLPVSKERVISEAESQNTALAYITIIPSDDACSFGGTSWLMLVNAFTGTALTYSPYDVDNNGYIDSNDVTTAGDTAAGRPTTSIAFNSTSVGTAPGEGTPGDFICPPRTRKQIRFVTLSDGTIQPVPECIPSDKLGRNSWRELQF